MILISVFFAKKLAHELCVCLRSVGGLVGGLAERLVEGVVFPRAKKFVHELTFVFSGLDRLLWRAAVVARKHRPLCVKLVGAALLSPHRELLRLLTNVRQRGVG